MSSISRYFILTVFAFFILSCENSKSESEISSAPLYPVGREYKVSLNIAPFLEIGEEPLGRASTPLPGGLYAVNVFWKGKGITSFQPYASGLFGNPHRVEIGLIEGYVYRFDCSFLGSEELPYYETRNDSTLYGLPFSCSPQKAVDGFVKDDLLISLNPLNINQSFFQHIYKGEMQITEKNKSTHPTVKRYFGSQQLEFLSPATNPSVSITLKRAYYSMQFTTNELSPGDSVRIEAKDISPMYLLHSNNGTSKTEERLISMYDISDYYTARLKEDETISFTISYRPANEEEWHPLFSEQNIKMKRNKKNIVNIVKINKHTGEAAISFDENTEMEEAGQEIGNE